MTVASSTPHQNTITENLLFSLENVPLPPNDPIAVISMSLYMLEQHWERQYRDAWKSCATPHERQELRSIHGFDLARIESARMQLNKLSM